MKKYRLKKDLLFYNAGDGNFYIDDEGNLQYASPNKGETIFLVSALRDHPKILEDWFEEIEEAPKTVWDLKRGDNYYFLYSQGLLCKEVWTNHFLDEGRREIGNCLLTEEEAEKELARRKAKVILERDTKGFRPDWTDMSQNKFCVSFYLFCGSLTKSNLGHLQPENTKWLINREIYFATEKDAWASIKKHEKEWKIYLGVEE